MTSTHKEAEVELSPWMLAPEIPLRVRKPYWAPDYHPILDVYRDRLSDEIAAWCDEELEGEHRFTKDGERCALIFSEPRDAVLFKLRWYGA